MSDAPDYEHVFTLVAAMSDAPDWQETAVGPGGTPIGSGALAINGGGGTDAIVVAPGASQAYNISPALEAGAAFFIASVAWQPAAAGYYFVFAQIILASGSGSINGASFDATANDFPAGAADDINVLTASAFLAGGDATSQLQVVCYNMADSSGNVTFAGTMVAAPNFGGFSDGNVSLS